MRDVDEAIWRVRQAQHHGNPLTEDELVQAAEVLGSQLGRRDAQEAATVVLHWLNSADGDVPVDPQAGAVSPAWDAAPSPGRQGRRSRLAGLGRTAVAVVLAAVAVVLWFAMAPTTSATAART